MTEDEFTRLAHLLEQLRDGQRLQLERQAEALALQREQFDMARRQFESAARLQERAEALQERSRALVETSRKAVAVVLPILFGLVAYLTWLLFR